MQSSKVGIGEEGKQIRLLDENMGELENLTGRKKIAQDGLRQSREDSVHVSLEENVLQ